MTDANILPEPVRIHLNDRSYDIRFLEDFSGFFSNFDFKGFESLIVFSNRTIWDIYGQSFTHAAAASGLQTHTFLMGDGEKYKSVETVSNAWDFLIKEKFTRKACIIAFGGGVVGDLAGFVAATYLRGIDFVQVPTTVVSMVDSSVGGKTGVDHPLGKNLIGAFYQPKLVAVIPGLLDTLDEHNLRGGFAEVIKYGVIYDKEFFTWLEQNLEQAIALNPEAIAHVVKRSCEIKADVVSQDEHEHGLRAILNYGHTFGHAIESLGEYQERQFHGQAVAIGMCCAADTAVAMDLMPAEDAKRIEALIERAGLPRHVAPDMDPLAIYERMFSDKKVAAGKIRFVLPTRIGHVDLFNNVSRDLVLQVLKSRQISD